MGLLAWIGTICLLVAPPPGALITEVDVPAVEARLTLDAAEATVGDHIEATLVAELPAGFELELREIGPALGPFLVVSGGWAEPEAGGEGVRWTWRGRIAAYETGTLEIPEIRLRARDDAKEIDFASAAVEVEVLSLLDEEEPTEGEPDISDLKGPASMPARYRALWLGLGGLLLLLAGAGLIWWLQRRYGARLAAARIPEDPFRRIPPHEWIYRELQKLLDRRLEDSGESELFFSELSRILKLYLGGRYRVDLMEHTTEEVPQLLRQAGAPEAPGEEVSALLRRCDLVKFAKSRPAEPEWREAVDSVYRIVDSTKPTEAAGAGTERGAA